MVPFCFHLRRLIKGGVYSRAAFNRVNTVIKSSCMNSWPMRHVAPSLAVSSYTSRLSGRVDFDEILNLSDWISSFPTGLLHVGY